MTRELSPTSFALVAEQNISFAVLLELEFASGPVRLWSGVGDLSFGGKTWVGTGQLGSLSGVTEATDLSDTVIRARLSHIDAALMPEVVAEVTEGDPVGCPFAIFLAFFEPDGSVKNAVTLTSGFIDAVELAAGEAGALTLDLVTEGGQMARSRFYRLSDAHQKKLFPGDRGLEFVSNLDSAVAIGSAQVTRLENRHFAGTIR